MEGKTGNTEIIKIKVELAKRPDIISNQIESFGFTYTCWF